MQNQTESSTSRQPLDQRWVAKIFQELQGNYGTRFLNQWKTGQTLDDGTDAGVVNAMSMWGKKLGGFSDQPERIRRVLDSLPADPPSLPQFIELCRTARANEPKALPHKLTAEDHERLARAAMEAKRAVERSDADKVMFWATHPKGHAHMQFIREAAQNDARFLPCIAEMTEKGICTEDGHLLKRYRDGQWWPIERRA